MERVIDTIQVGTSMKSPCLGNGVVTSIDHDSFYVKFNIVQIVYDAHGRVYPKGKVQSVFLSE